MSKLRDYQKRSIDMLYDWFNANPTGNPCLNLPTGSGKSHIVAALCKDALQNWPETRILMLTHQKELIEQNAEKLREHWPGAPLGIYSAGIGRKDLGEPITFAGIQSVRDKADLLGFTDLVIIDECHLVNHKSEGGYRTLLEQLKNINPKIRVIGLTATPYRLGHGLITDGDALFDDLIEPVSIEELVFKKHLAPLKSKLTDTALDVSKVKKRGGEYIESELQKAVNKASVNNSVISEVMQRAGERKAWLFFCAGIDHAKHISDLLNERGVKSECITGKTSKGKRAQILQDFKAGRIKALTNANVLTTGFDYPDIDLIAFLRPTLSPALYVQMAGRGMRQKSHTDHCLVLDFAGNVSLHGPITKIKAPNKEGKGGDAPIKVCEKCSEIVHSAVKQCQECGFIFPRKDENELKLKLNNQDIMGLNYNEMKVSKWRWKKYISRSQKEMITVTFYGQLSDRPVTEYFAVTHEGKAREYALKKLMSYVVNSGQDRSVLDLKTLEEVVDAMNKRTPPSLINYTRDGQLCTVLSRKWSQAPCLDTQNH